MNQNTNKFDKVERKRKRRILTPQEERWKIQALWLCSIFFGLFLGELVLYLLIWNFNDWTCVLILQIILIMPAYLSNAGMLLFGKGGKPLDKGYSCKDGNRLFGPGKTIKGFILGPVFGILVSLCIHGIFYLTWSGIEDIIILFWEGKRQYILFHSTPTDAIYLFKLYMIGARGNENFIIGFIKLLIRVTLVSFGAASGDLLGSWLKRRVNKKRGDPAWGVDQLDFVLPAIFISMPFVLVDLRYIAIIVFILIFTPSMAIIANTVSYLSGLKDVPY